MASEQGPAQLSSEREPGAAQRLPSLTGLRAAAAAVVFVSHARWWFPIDPITTVAGRTIRGRDLMQQGGVGVSFFFVLSGFVLCWSARATDHPGAFYRRRLARIGPLQVVTWAISLGLVAVGTIRAVPAVVAALNLLLLQAWSPDQRVHFSLDQPSWSLSCELFFYALFPLLLLVSRGLGLRPTRPPDPDSPPTGDVARQRAWLLLVAGVVATVAVQALLTLALRSDRKIGVDDDVWLYLGYAFPPVRLLEFVVGFALALVVRRSALRLPGLGWALAATAVAYVVAGQIPRPFSGVAVTLVPFLWVIAAAAQRDQAGRGSWWSSPLLVHLGRLSFAFYLVQWLVIESLARAHGSGVQPWARATLLTLAALAITLVASEVVHRLVERPAERWLRSGHRVIG